MILYKKNNDMDVYYYLGGIIMKINVKEVLIIIVFVTIAIILSIFGYWVTCNKTINLPNENKIEKIILKDKNNSLTIESKNDINNIYNITNYLKCF